MEDDTDFTPVVPVEHGENTLIVGKGRDPNKFFPGDFHEGEFEDE